MEPRTLETYRQRLLTLQQQVVQRIFGQEEAMYAMDADRDIERTDRIQEEAAEVTLTALEEHERREMAEIQAALARIDAGTYGACDTCGAVISPARLAALPMARRCVRCQGRLEKGRKE
jgi:RNA polymerase-binding transcription factor